MHEHNTLGREGSKYTLLNPLETCHQMTLVIPDFQNI